MATEICAVFKSEFGEEILSNVRVFAWFTWHVCQIWTIP